MSWNSVATFPIVKASRVQLPETLTTTKGKHMKTETALSIAEIVTDSGKRYFINGKRVSHEDVIIAKFGKRLDCFVTRATAKVVRNYCVAHAVATHPQA